jgi:hypothetical protein
MGDLKISSIRKHDLKASGYSMQVILILPSICCCGDFSTIVWMSCGWFKGALTDESNPMGYHKTPCFFVCLGGSQCRQ